MQGSRDRDDERDGDNEPPKLYLCVRRICGFRRPSFIMMVVRRATPMLVPLVVMMETKKTFVERTY